MDYDKLTAQYKSNLHKNEREMDELLSKKRKLEELRQLLFDYKRRDTAYYDQLKNEMYAEGAKQDLRILENFTGAANQDYMRMERDFEQEAAELARKKKQLSTYRDTLQSEYRREARKH